MKEKEGSSERSVKKEEQKRKKVKKMIRGGKGRERDKTKTKQAEETGKVRNTKRGGEAEANC